MEHSAKKVLVVGAGGFIGGFIAAEALRRGYDTWVAVRESTSRRWLTDERLKFVVLDYDNTEAMERELAAAGVRWDYIIYNLATLR